MRLFLLTVLITVLSQSFTPLQARMLDKIIAVFNDKVITYSEIERMKENLVARQNISPQIYQKTSYTQRELIKKVIHRYLIRAKLEEMGYSVSDDQVESQIKATEDRLGLDRDSLLQFLESNNTTFDEYFEIIRETIEFNLFNSRVIKPLITITDQEVKNSYYEKNLENKTLAFKYSLVDFSLPESKMTEDMVDNFQQVMSQFQVNGILPEKYRDVSTTSLGDITEDDLTQDIVSVLKRTKEGSFSKPVLIGSAYHVFFVKKKDLVESSSFKRAKPRIRNELYKEAFDKVTELWFRRESNKHFIKYMLSNR